MHKFTKKRIAIGALGLLAVVGVAVAYFTTTGSGSGNAKVGTSTPLEITAEAPTTLYPGTKSKVKFEVTTTSKGKQRVGTVSLTGVTAYPSKAKAEAEEEAIGGCPSSWFNMTPVAANQEVPGETTTALTAEGEIEFENKSESQDACKNAYLVASFSSN